MLTSRGSGMYEYFGRELEAFPVASKIMSQPKYFVNKAGRADFYGMELDLFFRNPRSPHISTVKHGKSKSWPVMRRMRVVSDRNLSKTTSFFKLETYARSTKVRRSYSARQ